MSRILTILFISLSFTLVSKAAETGTRHVESAGGFSFCPPKAWVMREFPGIKYQLATGQASDGFASNINVVDESSDMPLKDYVKATVTTLAKVLKGFKHLGQTEFKTQSGLKGHRLVVEAEQQGKQVRQVFFFFDGKAGKKLVVTCTALASQNAKLDQVFEDSMKTFALTK